MDGINENIEIKNRLKLLENDLRSQEDIHDENYHKQKAIEREQKQKLRQDKLIQAQKLNEQIFKHKKEDNEDPLVAKVGMSEQRKNMVKQMQIEEEATTPFLINEHLFKHDQKQRDHKREYLFNYQLNSPLKNHALDRQIIRE